MTKAFSFRLLGVLVCAALLAGAPSAKAEEKASSVAAVIIDVQRILQESLAAKSAQQQLEQQRIKFQTQIASEEDELRKSEDELTKSRDKLSADVYADREQQLRQRFLVVERHVQARRKALDQAFTDSMNKVREGLQDVVGGVAHERGISLVLVKQQALWSDKSLDITDEVLGRLNKTLPTVNVNVSAEDGEQPETVVYPTKKADSASKKPAAKK